MELESPAFIRREVSPGSWVLDLSFPPIPSFLLSQSGLPRQGRAFPPVTITGPVKASGMVGKSEE